MYRYSLIVRSSLWFRGTPTFPYLSPSPKDLSPSWCTVPNLRSSISCTNRLTLFKTYRLRVFYSASLYIFFIRTSLFVPTPVHSEHSSYFTNLKRNGVLPRHLSKSRPPIVYVRTWIPSRNPVVIYGIPGLLRSFP